VGAHLQRVAVYDVLRRYCPSRPRPGTRRGSSAGWRGTRRCCPTASVQPRCHAAI
jgi:hypothetical protein